MEKNGISEEVFDDFMSRIKTEKLILKGAIKVQDELYIEVGSIQGAIEQSSIVSLFSCSNTTLTANLTDP